MLISLIHRFVRARIHSLGIESRWADFSGCRLHYYEYRHPHPRGTLLLLHGLGTSSSTWFHLYPFFQREHSFVAVDLPGFGFSTIKNGKPFFSLQDHVLSVEALAERLGLSSCTVIGHSLGGWVAAKYSAGHRQQVNRLVLINPAGVYVDGIEKLRTTFDIRTTEDVRRLVNAMWFRYPWYFKPFLPAILSDLLKRNVPQLVQSIQRDEFLDADLEKLTMPLNLIWGSEDRLLSVESIQVMERRVKTLKVNIIDGCGHVPQLEKPDALQRILERITA